MIKCQGVSKQSECQVVSPTLLLPLQIYIGYQLALLMPIAVPISDLGATEWGTQKTQFMLLKLI